MSIPFLELYESIDIIGNGSFGVIRKVRRKTDGQIFARKELKFERMTERDRKQIVAEVNILKDLHHEHIVRYHDRYLCDTIVPIPEDTIWNYFMQILLALNHCHHPNGHSRTSSSGSGGFDADTRDRRSQILHLFLDDNNLVKLGDFASFANTYVGTPYYMSPELMQEKAYDSKSDIWSLGCLIYELCALKPPFHEAKTHAELNIFIRNGRIPPLPKSYSQSLQGIIKAMLNLNPAMRPSAQQLLHHERLELVFKVSETEKMLNAVKSHKAAVTVKEKEEQHVESLLAQKDCEIASLHQVVTNLQAQIQQQSSSYTPESIAEAIREAVAQRENELRVLVGQREKEVEDAIAQREQDLMEAMRRREAEVVQAWETRENEIRSEVAQQLREAEEQVTWVTERQEELRQDEERLDTLRAELEKKNAKSEANKGRKAPLEEVKNVLRPVERTPKHPPSAARRTGTQSIYSTPMSQPMRGNENVLQSAMKGVVFTATGQTLTTPARPLEIDNIFNKSPKVGLDFGKIFETSKVILDSEVEQSDDEHDHALDSSAEDDLHPSPPPSPTSKRERERMEQQKSSRSSASSVSSSTTTTRLRRPSIRRQSRTAMKTSASDSVDVVSPRKARSLSRGPSGPSARMVLHQKAPSYDLADEANLPSPFLKRTERSMAASNTEAATAQPKKRISGGNLLRAVAAANSAGRRGSISSTDSSVSAGTRTVGARKSIKALS
ncbi:kinase-like domain-containing protein [Flagelloscypha sp. PMI_526]|nr:kinase-like domain-containing protein [Flagelloscypha sp. PMI_526]